MFPGTRCPELGQLYEKGIETLNDLERRFWKNGTVDETELANLEGILSLDELRFKEAIIIDYGEAMADLKAFGFLNAESDQTVRIPTFQEIFSWITPLQASEYLRMEREGLDPRLQISLIDMPIQAIANKIKRVMSKKNGSLGIQNLNGLIEAENEDMYPNHRSKADWVKDNQGILIEIVPSKLILEEVKNADQIHLLEQKIDADTRFEYFSMEGFLFYLMRLIRENKLSVNEDVAIFLGNNRYLNVPFAAFWEKGNLHLDFLNELKIAQIKWVALPTTMQIKKPR